MHPTHQFGTREPRATLKSHNPRWRDIWSPIRWIPELEVRGLLSSGPWNKKRLRTGPVKTPGGTALRELPAANSSSLPPQEALLRPALTIRPHLLVAIDPRKQGDRERMVRGLPRSKVFGVCSLCSSLLFGFTKPFLESQGNNDHPLL